jgi:hypothetical protein
LLVLALVLDLGADTCERIVRQRNMCSLS